MLVSMLLLLFCPMNSVGVSSIVAVGVGFDVVVTIAAVVGDDLVTVVLFV